MSINWAAGLRGASRGLEGMVRVNQQNNEIKYRQIQQANAQRFRAQQSQQERDWRSSEAEAARDWREGQAELDRKSREDMAQANLDARSADAAATRDYQDRSLEERERHNRASEENQRTAETRRRVDSVRDRYTNDLKAIDEKMGQPLISTDPAQMQKLQRQRDALIEERDRETMRAELDDDAVKAYDTATRTMSQLRQGAEYARQYAQMDPATRASVDVLKDELKKQQGMSDDEALATAIWQTLNGGGQEDQGFIDPQSSVTPPQQQPGSTPFDRGLTMGDVERTQQFLPAS